MKKTFLFLALIGICGFFTILQMIFWLKMGEKDAREAAARKKIPPRDAISTSNRHQQWLNLLSKRRDKSVWANTKDGAYIHMGKTGGSSLSLLMRNGCHSFMPKPCRDVGPLETIVSKMVGTYYHVPDFGLIPQGKHSFYIISVRDPLARAISAFVYEHIDNMKARNETMSPLAEEAKVEAKKCFPSLETFVEYVGDDPHHYDYPYHRSQIVATDCTALARAVVDGKVRRFNHFFFPIEKIRSFIGEATNSNNNKAAQTNNNPLIFATRQEHLWYDWKKINYLLGQVGDVVIPVGNNNDNNNNKDGGVSTTSSTTKGARDLSNVHQPITRELSDLGKRRLCNALQPEYTGYVNLLREAINLSDDDLQETFEEISRNCPYVIIPQPALPAATNQQQQ